MRETRCTDEKQTHEITITSATTNRPSILVSPVNTLKPHTSLYLYLPDTTGRSLDTQKVPPHQPPSRQSIQIYTAARTSETDMYNCLFVSCSRGHTRPRDLSLTKHVVGPQDLELAGEEREESAAHLQGPRRRGVWTQLRFGNENFRAVYIKCSFQAAKSGERDERERETLPRV